MYCNQGVQTDLSIGTTYCNKDVQTDLSIKTTCCNKGVQIDLSGEQVERDAERRIRLLKNVSKSRKKVRQSPP